METTKSILISKKVKRVSLQRYLWSKIAYDDKVTFRIMGGLLLNQLWLEDKCSQDSEFKKKYKEILEISSILIKEFNLSKGLSPKALNKFKSGALTQLEGFLVPRRNYSQWKARFDSSVVLIHPKPLGVPTKNLPSERYIGVGYRDKGTAKNPAEDGSPSWQEVAQSNANLKRIFEDNMALLEGGTLDVKEKLVKLRENGEILEKLKR